VEGRWWCSIVVGQVMASHVSWVTKVIPLGHSEKGEDEVVAS
jgi:hypothetical protein